MRIKISTKKELQSVLLDCDTDDVEELPLYAVLTEGEWELELPDGGAYASSDEVNQDWLLKKLEGSEFLKERRKDNERRE